MAAGRYHLSIIIFIDEESEYWNTANFQDNFDQERGMQYMTIGAGQSRLLNPKLKADINRPKDKDLSIKTDMIKLGEQEDDQELIYFVELFDNFIENSKLKPIDYDLFPRSGGSGYNSNSFVTGFLQAAGYKIEKPDRILPGFGKPVQVEYFSEPEEPEEQEKPWWKIW
ncbi:hypothetical protein [Paenibacillus chungangensis]|uniref:DUF4365 domain-containing protein n=1 Tax=Paenibacillus chungangensis TaxID=696535 RepID=A0ABW3HNW3_9BACL